MNLQTIDWSMVGSATAVIGFIYGCFRSLKSDIKDQLNAINRRFEAVDSRFDTVNQYLAENHEHIIDIKERLSFLEAAMIYTVPLEAAQLNPRSAAAREMWKRRKQNKLEKKDG
jgi:hypothetical protein